MKPTRLVASPTKLWPNTMPVDCIASRSLADAVQARAGECDANIARAFLDHPTKVPPGAVKVEGYWTIGGQVHPLTWIQTADVIIDPTLAVCEPAALRQSAKYREYRRFSRLETGEHYQGKERGAGSNVGLIVDENDAAFKHLGNELDLGGLTTR